MTSTAERAALLILGTVGIGAVWLSVTWHQQLFIDLEVYRFAGRMWLADRPLYATAADVGTQVLPFIYPPFAAMLFAPLAAVPAGMAAGITTAAGVVSTYAIVLIVGRRFGLSAGFPAGTAAGVTLVALVSEPVRETLLLGQINLILAAVAAAECLLPRTPWPRGVLLGVAAAIKLTPAVFVLFFVLSGRRRATATTVVTFASCTLATAALAPGPSAAYWLDTLSDPKSVVPVFYGSNQSLLAVLSRWELPDRVETALWLAASAAVLLLAGWLARRALVSGRDVEALLVVAVAGLLVAPISWSHHWVLVVIILISAGWWALPALVARAPVRAAGALALLAVLLIGTYRLVPWHDGRELDWSVGQQIAGSSLVLVGLAVLVVLAVRARDRAPPLSASANGPASTTERGTHLGLGVRSGHEQ